MFQLAKQVEAGKFSFPPDREDVRPAARDLIKHMLRVAPGDRPTAAEVRRSKWMTTQQQPQQQQEEVEVE